MQCNGTGEKVVAMKEFFDSAGYGEYFGRLQAHLAAAAGEQT